MSIPGTALGSLARRTLSTVAACAVLAGSAGACGFHMYAPEKTVIDWLVEGDHVVVARNAPGNPFAYVPVETLVDNGEPVAIGALVDSATRRRLALNPEDGVLFVHEPSTGRWERLAYLTPDYRDLVETVLSRRAGWTGPYDPDRFALFEGLQTHPSPAMRTLALREIDQAPYEMLRDIDLRIPVDDLLAGVRDPNGFALRPIRVLLLGLSDDPKARSALRTAIDSMGRVDTGSFILGAYATALIEIDGAAGIARLEDAVLNNPLLGIDTLEQVVSALAIHGGSGSPDLQGEIQKTLVRLMDARPVAAAAIARQYFTREDWSQADILEPVLRSGRLADAAVVMPVAMYLAQARAVGGWSPDTSSDG